MNEVESSCDHTVHPAEVTFVSTTIIVQKKCYKSVKILHTELLRFLNICIFYSMGVRTITFGYRSFVRMRNRILITHNLLKAKNEYRAA